MRKILLMRLFYLKKLDFKQLLQTYENREFDTFGLRKVI